MENQIPDQKREIDALVHEVPPSTVPLEKPQPPAIIPTNLIDQGRVLWSKESHEHAEDYEFGLSLGKYGDSIFSVEKFLKRLNLALPESIQHICSKADTSSENFRVHFDMLSSILSLIAKEFASKNLPATSTKSLVAIMHGFFESYVNERITKQQQKKEA